MDNIVQWWFFATLSNDDWDSWLIRESWRKSAVISNITKRDHRVKQVLSWEAWLRRDAGSSSEVLHNRPQCTRVLEGENDRKKDFKDMKKIEKKSPKHQEGRLFKTQINHSLSGKTKCRWEANTFNFKSFVLMFCIYLVTWGDYEVSRKERLNMWCNVRGL